MRPQKFSRRTAWDTTETAWASLLRERRAAGLPILDLTASNPTKCGFDYDGEAIFAALRNSAALEYDPNPKGLATAREAVTAYYADHAASVDPEHIFLTTSTSEAYSFLFRLLCDPGDEILVAQPSYPLFDFLADLDDVRLVSYPLFYDYGWYLDPGALRQRITSRTKAIVVVHPNNPTGHFTKAVERQILEGICAEHGLALIVDEVFLDYPLLEGSIVPSFATGEHPVTTFVLSGISKIAALPQMKAAWIVCFGPAPTLHEALERLEVIADTFLSMNAPIQLALPRLLASRASIRTQIETRVKGNLKALDEVVAGGNLIRRLVIEAGWYAILRVPVTEDDEKTVLRLLVERGVAIHSGDSFGLGRSGWLVTSLLPLPTQFLEGITCTTNLIHLGNKS